MARKRKFYRITATQFDILAHAVQTLVDEYPGSQNDLFTLVVNDIKLAHAPKVKSQVPVTETSGMGDCFEKPEPTEVQQGSL